MGEDGRAVTAALAGCEKQLAALRTALRKEKDQESRVAAASRALAMLRAEAVRVAELRDTSIAKLVDAGRTYQQVAEASGVTRGRVAHIVSQRRNGA
jgi:hypothetical protein